MTKNLLLVFSTIFILFSNFISAQDATLEASLELQEVGGIQVPYQNGFPLPTFEKQNRKVLNLEGTWKKQRFAADDNITLAKRDEAGLISLTSEAAGRESSGFDDSGWDTKHLPGVENNLNPANTPPEIYQDGVWYRRTFEIEESDTNKFIKLMFYAVNYVADVWINGEYIGYHEGGYTPFAFDVSDYLNAGSNVIAVRVDNIRWGSRNDIVPPYQSDWFNYSGIIHDVYLEFSDPVSVARANIVPVDLEGNIEATIIVNNRTGVTGAVNATLNVFEANIDSTNIQSELVSDIVGSEVAVSGDAEQEIEYTGDASTWRTNLNIPAPKLWSPKHPDLYVLKVTLTQDGNIIDEYYTQFGIRTVRTKGNKFLLNNKIIFLTGIARHEEHPDYGRSVPKDIIYSDLTTIKSLNSNFVRTAHYPNHLYTYMIADRLGIGIMEEIPVWWFDTPEPWIAQNTRLIHKQMFREMVFKDYNRPSIMLWSTSNECKEETNRIIYNQMIVDDLRDNYNDGRLVSQSSAGDNPGPDDITQGPLDVAGWTLYFGVFHGSSYYAGTLNFLLQAKNNFPNMPLIDTEFGFWSSENGSTTERQETVFNETFKAFKFFASLNVDGTINNNGCLMACTWWCIYDWYQPKSNGYQTMGLISMDRQTYKPVASALSTTYLPYFNHEGVVTDVEENDEVIPSDFDLLQNYPNPFNPSTSISYQLPASGFVSLKIYDVLGKEVSVLVNEEKPAGKYEVMFNSKDFSSGIYFYTLKSNGSALTKKMVLLK